MKPILVATDGGEAASHALEVAIEIARDSGASIEVISVRPQLPDAGARAPILEVDELAGPEHIAGEAARRAREAGVRASPHAAHGDIVSCIANAARTLDADLIVVGSRGIGSARGAALGSVSQALVRHSPVSVTVVHEPAIETAEVSQPASESRARERESPGWSMFE